MFLICIGRGPQPFFVGASAQFGGGAMPIVHSCDFTQDSPAQSCFSSAAQFLWGLFVICLMGALPAAAQSCPAPWATAANVYGMVTLEGQGAGTSGDYKQSVNQYAVAAGKLASFGPGSCVWEAIPNIGFGQMRSQASINDSFTDTANGNFCKWSASGIGDSLWDGLTFQIIPATSQYNIEAIGAVFGKFTNNQGSSNEDIVWGSTFGDGGVSEQQVPFPPGAPLLYGSHNYQLPPFEDAQCNLDIINADWQATWLFTPAPDGTCKDCDDQRGSQVSIRNQSLGEDIDIVNTPFSLHYESQRAAGRAGADLFAVKDALSLGGWTLSAHHVFEPLLLTYCSGGSCTAYSIVPKALYLGDGTARNSAEVQAPLVVGPNLELTSEDGSEIYVFDSASGRHLQTLLPMTGAVLYNFGYDPNGLLISVTDGSGNVTTIQRDANGHPTAIVSPYGQTTNLSVDANGHLSQVTDPMGHAIKLATSALGLLSSFRDANGNLYSFQYDSNGFLIKDSDPAGGVLNLALTNNASGYSVAETTAQGRVKSNNVAFSNTSSSTTQTFTNTWTNGLQAGEADSQQNGQFSEAAALPNGTSYGKTYGPDPRWGIQIPIDVTETLTYGNLTTNISNSRTASLSDPTNPFSLITQTDSETINGRIYKSVFTGATKTFVDTTPVGRKTTTVLDTLERVSTVQPAAGELTSFTYDSRGRLGSATEGSRQTTFSYDSNGRVALVTDPLNLTEGFTYDADGRLLTKTLEDGRVITYSYDNNGNITSVTPPGASAHDLTYSAVNLPISYSPPVVSGSGPTTYSFSPDREITKITRPDGEVISYNYDTAGRVSSLVTPAATLNFGHDPTTGNLASASVSGGEAIAYSYNGPLPTGSTWTGTVAGSVSRAYNNNFWLSSESINGGNNVTFTYDKDGLVSKAGAVTLKYNAKTGLYTGGTLGKGIDTIAYSTYAEPSTHTAKFGTSILYKAAYKRDNLGRITSLTDTIGGSATTYSYTFDAAGRLTEVDSGTGKKKVVLARYHYDSNSNRLSVTTPSGTVNGSYDAQDRLLTYGNASFTYTANGELATKSSGSNLTTYQYDVLGNLTSVTLPNGTQVSYVVDAENNRVGKKVNSVLTTGFLYDGRNLVAQLDGNNQIVSQFIYGSARNCPDYMVTGGVTYRIFSDHLGSPRLVVNTSTGQIAQRMDYDEFGNVINDTNPGFQPFGFAGGLYDQDTKLVRFGARDYDPTVGRWTAKDPISFSGGDTNLYGYVLNDPVNMVDPGGLEGDCICQKPWWNFVNGFVDETSHAVLTPLFPPLAIAQYLTGAKTPGELGRVLSGTTGAVDMHSMSYVNGATTGIVVATAASIFFTGPEAAAEGRAAVNSWRAARDAKAMSQWNKAQYIKAVEAEAEAARKAKAAKDQFETCDAGKGVTRKWGR
jgi:RHS repeat-associated protein